MKKSFFFAITGCALVFSACKKDKADPVSANQPYSNINTGTNWTYDVKTQDPTTGDTTVVVDTLTVTPTDTTVDQGGADQRVYRIVKHSSGANSYYNITGNDYYQFQELAMLGAQIQALYLKDNLDVNGSWSQDQSVNVTGIPFPVTVHLASTITEKGITRTINGVTYTDVINVKTDLTVPGLTVTSNIKNYYARNIGLIEGDYDIDMPGLTSIHSQTLIKTADPH